MPQGCYPTPFLSLFLRSVFKVTVMVLSPVSFVHLMSHFGKTVKILVNLSQPRYSVLTLLVNLRMKRLERSGNSESWFLQGEFTETLLSS